MRPDRPRTSRPPDAGGSHRPANRTFILSRDAAARTRIVWWCSAAPDTAARRRSPAQRLAGLLHVPREPPESPPHGEGFGLWFQVPGSWFRPPAISRSRRLDVERGTAIRSVQLARRPDAHRAGAGGLDRRDLASGHGATPIAGPPAWGGMPRGRSVRFEERCRDQLHVTWPRASARSARTAAFLGIGLMTMDDRFDCRQTSHAPHCESRHCTGNQPRVRSWLTNVPRLASQTSQTRPCPARRSGRTGSDGVPWPRSRERVVPRASGRHRG
jgi:hypothetical protein